MNKKQVIRKIVISIGLPLLLGILLPVEARAQEAPAAKKESSGPMMRFLCLEELPVDGELVLATKGEEGEWLEQGPVSLRSSFITSWQKAAWGPLYLARRKGDDLEPIGSFILKEGVKRSIVVLMPDKKKGVYRADVINPAEFKFRKGMTLVTNYSKVPALVMLGKKKDQVMPGKRVASRATAGDDGMYRMLVGYQDEKKALIPCYDRYIASNPDAREFLLLFPDSTTGLKVFSLSEFGPFE